MLSVQSNCFWIRGKYKTRYEENIFISCSSRNKEGSDREKKHFETHKADHWSARDR